MLEYAKGQLLGRASPSVTTPVTVFTASMRTEITVILLACTGASSTDIVIFHATDTPPTYDATTTIINSTRVTTDTDLIFQSPAPGSGVHLALGDSIGLSASVINNVTISLYGITETIAPQPTRGSRRK